MAARKLTLAAVVVCACACPALADATRMCLEVSGATEEICACATEALGAEIGEEDLALYDAIGARYLDNKAAGQAMADAWDAAAAEVATQQGLDRRELLSRMNEAGQKHRAAMGGCAS